VTSLATALVQAARDGHGTPHELRALVGRGLVRNAGVDALRTLYRAAWEQGAKTARDAVRAVRPTVKADTSPPPPPGVPPPAAAPVPMVDVVAFLASADQVWDGIADHVGDQIADVVVSLLASNGNEGVSVAEVESAIRDVTGAPHADMIAQTETTRALTAAAYDQYHTLGVRRVEFLATDDPKVCPRCAANEDQGPVDIGAEFVNGAPPVHPRCRCAVEPAFSDDDMITDLGDTSG